MSTTFENVALANFFASARDGLFIPRSPDLFLPDNWTRIFARGLETLAEQGAFEGKTVLEVGIGTGVVMAGLSSMPNGPKLFMGTDICAQAVAASKELANRLTLRNVSRLVQSDLLFALSAHDLKDVGHIVACIPQVPAPSNVDLSANDNFAHYYSPQGTCWDDFGLGLNARLIAEVNEKAPQATLTLNLAGRPGIEHLLTLFKMHERKAQITHCDIVPQHSGTSLASLAEREDPDHPFEFFADADGKEQISASIAEAKRAQGSPVYHKVYVLTAPGGPAR
jgi:hypothetical protein